MNQFSPNLKPKPLYSHSDKAQHLGVPRANLLDLRKPEDATEPLEVRNTKLAKVKKPSWWQRRKLAKQQLHVSQQRRTAIPVVDTTVAVSHEPLTSTIESDVQDSVQDLVAKESLIEKPDTDKLATEEPATAELVSDELIAAPVPEAAKIHQSALHQAVAYDERAEQLAQERVAQDRATLLAAREAEREARRQAKREAKQQRIEARRQANADAFVKREQSRQSANTWRMIFGQIFGQAVRSIAVFALMLSVLVAPFAALGFYKHVSTIRDAVVEVSQEAVAQLALGGQLASNLDFLSAEQSFAVASTNFNQAHNELLSVSSVMTPLVRAIPEAGDQFTSAENILIAGENIAAAGEDVAKAFAILSDLQIDGVSTDTNTDNDTNNTTIALTDALVVAHSTLRPALPRLELASLALSDVDVSTVPEEYREDITLAKDVIPTVEASVRQLLELSETLLVILGHEESKRYLVIFQNSAEMRPTGGFIGSFAVVDIDQGRVSNLEIPYGGPYDLLYNMQYKVISPTPLHFVNPHWQMHDANWWPHTPSSFQLVQKMYRKQGGTSVDGVISLTPEVIENMLEITGPIPMPEYTGTLSLSDSTDSTDTVGATLESSEEDTDDTTNVDTPEEVIITADNFYRYTQEQAERKFDDTNQSKKFIADLTPKLLDRLFSMDTTNILPVLQLFSTSLDEKDILLYFNDAFLQDEMSKRGWTGEVESTPNDYLQVVDTNIAGGKTNRVIEKVITHHADVQSDGAITVTTEVQWTHRGASGDALEDINNMNYVRFYVPEGSELLSAEGFTQPNPKLKLDPEPEYEYSEDLQAISGDILIDEATQMRINTEFNKTVFGNFVETAPGETSKVSVSYTLPFTLDIDDMLNPADAYSILVQKQPGDFDPLIISSVSFPGEYVVRWTYPDAIARSTSSGSQEITLINAQLKRDIFAGLVLEQ